MKKTKKKVSRQESWAKANYRAGKCRCGGKPWGKYAQCRKCVLRDRKRDDYKGVRVAKGRGRPPGRRAA